MRGLRRAFLENYVHLWRIVLTHLVRSLCPRLTDCWHSPRRLSLRGNFLLWTKGRSSRCFLSRFDDAGNYLVSDVDRLSFLTDWSRFPILIARRFQGQMHLTILCLNCVLIFYSSETSPSRSEWVRCWGTFEPQLGSTLSQSTSGFCLGVCFEAISRCTCRLNTLWVLPLQLEKWYARTVCLSAESTSAFANRLI